MKTCRVCGEEKPLSEYTKSKGNRDGHVTICKPCDRAKAAAYRESHPTQWGEWYAVNRERYLATPRHRTPAQRAAAKRSQRERNRDRWREKRRSEKHAREAKLRGVERETVLLSVLIERDGARCQICGRTQGADEWTVDHVLPVSRGGAHTYVNCRLAHRSCNTRRGNRGAAQLRMMDTYPGVAPFS